MRSRSQGSRLKPAADGSSGKVGHEKTYISRFQWMYRTLAHFPATTHSTSIMTVECLCINKKRTTQRHGGHRQSDAASHFGHAWFSNSFCHLPPAPTTVPAQRHARVTRGSSTAPLCLYLSISLCPSISPRQQQSVFAWDINRCYHQCTVTTRSFYHRPTATGVGDTSAGM
ncbi:hypothetical protein CGCTS75_v009840 [Colletotrichum tropicale]|nr:hypothetical protein CGCTS75_v009840 [Colletotrichum tropicale]